MKKCFFNSIKIIVIFLTIIYSSSNYRVSARDYTDVAEGLKSGAIDVDNLETDLFDALGPLLIKNLLNQHFYTVDQCNDPFIQLNGCSDNTFTLYDEVYSILPRTRDSDCSILSDVDRCEVNENKICNFQEFQDNNGLIIYKSNFVSTANPDFIRCGSCQFPAGYPEGIDDILYERVDNDITNIKFESNFDDINHIDFQTNFPNYNPDLTLKIFRAYLINQVLTNSDIEQTNVCTKIPADTTYLCNSRSASDGDLESGYINNRTCFKGVGNYTDNTISATYHSIFGLTRSYGTWELNNSLMNICLSENYINDKYIDIENFGRNRLSVCKPGDFYSVLVDENQNVITNNNKPLISCGSSFNLYNKLNGHHCFANYGSVNSTPQGCGLEVSAEINGTPVTETLLCDPNNDYSYCVGYSDTTNTTITQGTINDTTNEPNELKNHAHRPENYPDTGFCLNCVSDNGSGILGKPCEIYNEAFITTHSSFDTLGIYDNCCSKNYFCSKDSETCQPLPNFSICSSSPKPFLQLTDDDVIPQGQVCNYVNDDTATEKRNNACDKCSAVGSPIKNSNDDDICPYNSIIPSYGVEVYNFSCRAHCGCLGDDKCIIPMGGDTGSCQAKACVDAGEENPNNLDCCDGNLTPNPTDSNKCSLDCGASEHDPNRGKCKPGCCSSGGTCKETDKPGNEICVYGPCKDSDINGCCGPGMVCDAQYDCKVASPTDNCGVSDDGRPPRGGYGRPDEAFSLEEFIRAIIGVLYPLSIVLGMIYIVMGGYQLVISKGDPEGTKKAQQTLTSAVTGLIFIILSATILRFIVNILIGI